MRYVTAGESHGPELTAIVSDVPAGIPIDIKNINADPRRRQAGYGRGARQQIEADQAVVSAGIRFGVTTGAPVAITVQNRDWQNWHERMAHFGKAPADLVREVTPRPGHADLVGVLKTNADDCRNILERSSARETAARVAAAGIAREFLAEVGVEVMSWVTSVGDVSLPETFELPDDLSQLQMETELSEMRCPDAATTEAMKHAIDEARAAGESLGGTFCVMAVGAVPGLGTYAAGPYRLTSQIGGALFSIPAVKGVEFGLGFKAARLPGSRVHDPIALEGCTFVRRGNNAGGLEGGMTTGAPIVARVAMKPIPTLMQPLETVNLDTLQPEQASRERSDVCAVPACAVVAEAELAFVIANAYQDAFGSTCMADIKANIASYLQRLKTMGR